MASGEGPGALLLAIVATSTRLIGAGGRRGDHGGRLVRIAMSALGREGTAVVGANGMVEL